MSKKVILEGDLRKEPKATANFLQFKDRTDPKYIGPGEWNRLHSKSFKATTHNEQLKFIEYVKEVRDTFPCPVCKNHFTEYLKNHPIEEYLNVYVDVNGEKKQLGLFVWTWKFHNAVNARLNKPIMSWDTCYNLYSETESMICSKHCSQADQPDQQDGLQTNLLENQDNSGWESQVNINTVQHKRSTKQPSRATRTKQTTQPTRQPSHKTAINTFEKYIQHNMKNQQNQHNHSSMQSNRSTSSRHVIQPIQPNKSNQTSSQFRLISVSRN